MSSPCRTLLRSPIPARRRPLAITRSRTSMLETYTVTVKALGFDKVVHINVMVEVNATVRTDFSLKAGSVSNEVTVTDSPPPLATDDAAPDPDSLHGRHQQSANSGTRLIEAGSYHGWSDSVRRCDRWRSARRIVCRARDSWRAKTTSRWMASPS